MAREPKRGPSGRPRVTPVPNTKTPTLSYAEFGNWYDRYRADVLEPALDAASSELDRELLDLLSDRDLARLRSATGRVKSKRRTWRKIRQPRYQGRITSLDDVPTVIDDLVGLRITCTNLRDIEMVQTALETLPRSPGSSALWLDGSTERDYVLEPKESGYRGWHVNLGVTLEVDGTPTAVACELQVRTLLQDSWGELTHEDTYSKDGALPPLVEVLSKRMADLFATLDDIAEDLRTELDRIDEAVVARSPDDADIQVDAPSPGSPTEQDADAAAFLVERWNDIDRPTDLAVLAWALQREFGAEVSDDWFGHGSFKRFLTHALPEAEITTGRHAFLLPEGTAAADVGDAEHSPESAPGAAEHVLESNGDHAASGEDGPERRTPDAAVALRRVDRAFPLLEHAQWELLFEQLAEAWKRNGPTAQSTADISRMVRSARDRADAQGTPISRRHLSYVARSVVPAETPGGPMTASELAETFATSTLQRMAELRILGARNRKGRAAVRAWLGG